MTQSVQHHHPHHRNLRIYKILEHMSCKQRRQELDSWQNAKSKRTLQGGKCPLAKVKGIYFNKRFFFCRYKQSVGKIITDKALCYYRRRTTFSKATIMAPNFSYFRQKQNPLSSPFDKRKRSNQ